MNFGFAATPPLLVSYSLFVPKLVWPPNKIWSFFDTPEAWQVLQSLPCSEVYFTGSRVSTLAAEVGRGSGETGDSHRN